MSYKPARLFYSLTCCMVWQNCGSQIGYSNHCQIGIQISAVPSFALAACALSLVFQQNQFAMRANCPRPTLAQLQGTKGLPESPFVLMLALSSPLNHTHTPDSCGLRISPFPRHRQGPAALRSAGGVLAVPQRLVGTSRGAAPARAAAPSHPSQAKEAYS